ncbi:MAG TPA: hypothetical protein VEY30_11275, partial [Myxococcaceae bacterium]|nr:hypothetical protein [Myxococcaceae bacterium]
MTPDSTHSLDREALVPVATAEDPATAERWTQLLKSEGIHVAHLPHGTGPVDVLTMGAHAWWEL